MVAHHHFSSREVEEVEEGMVEGELHITGVRLGFCCPAHPDWDDEDGHEKMRDMQNNPHLGDRVVRSLLTLDAWT